MEERHDEIVIYQSEDGLIKVDVLFENETVWLTQQQMSLLFQKDISVISRHIRNIFDEGKLDEKSNLHFLQIPNSDRPMSVMRNNSTAECPVDSQGISVARKFRSNIEYLKAEKTER